jgi:hypothetical protein
MRQAKTYMRWIELSIWVVSVPHAMHTMADSNEQFYIIYSHLLAFLVAAKSRGKSTYM